MAEKLEIVAEIDTSQMESGLNVVKKQTESAGLQAEKNLKITPNLDAAVIRKELESVKLVARDT